MYVNQEISKSDAERIITSFLCMKATAKVQSVNNQLYWRGHGHFMTVETLLDDTGLPTGIVLDDGSRLSPVALGYRSVGYIEPTAYLHRRPGADDLYIGGLLR